MRRRTFHLLGLLAVFSGGPVFPPAFAKDAVLIPGGRFAPLFGLEAGQKDLPVASFELDRLPVTQARFQEFVKANSTWARGKVPRLYADPGYLKNWSEDGPPKSTQRQAPVTWVSWFAAQAFCEAEGGRLPTLLEWEYAAAADETKPDASRDPAFAAKILAWYSKAQNSERLPEAGKGKPNYWRVHDLHGLVWEWTSDFNSVFVSGDNRQDGDRVANLFCGNGATGSTSREDYAAFMRYAMRSSLNADFTTANLGFRCAYDAPAKGGKNEKN